MSILNSKKMYEGYDLKKYDFLDLGCGDGGSIEYCKKHFNVKDGIGIDIREHRVKKAKDLGYSAIYGDIFDINVDYKFKFVSFMDVLEHLGGIDFSMKMIKKASTLASDFIFIRHPSFEDIDYLENLGLKITWYDWTDHTSLIKLTDYCQTFDRLGLKQYCFNFRKPITSSEDKYVIPYDSPIDTLEYNSETLPKKKKIEFGHTIYGQIDIFVALKPIPFPRWNWITREGR